MRHKAIMRHPYCGPCMLTTRRPLHHVLRPAILPAVAVFLLAPQRALAAPVLDGAALRWPWAIPFIGILLTIATGPLLFPKVWHNHYGKLAFIWSTFTVAPLAALYGVPTAVAAFVHTMLAEFLSFIVLLFTLYVVAGGILVTGNLRGTPLVNMAILALGTSIASVVGTTGAAMILIRPLIRANATRLHNVHVVVFFIFLVGNIGGALSPLGDPPLFVGFLRGVDFFWTATHLWRQTALVGGLVLAAFVALDLWYYRQDRLITTVGENVPPIDLRVRGSINLVLIAGVVAAILASATWKPGMRFDVYGTVLDLQNVVRDVVLLLIALLSLLLTPNEHREANGFTWGPIAEVAILFAGIFTCIIPVHRHARGRQGGRLLVAARRGHRAGRKPARDCLFLADRDPLGPARQRADLSGVLRAGGRRGARSHGSACCDARGDLSRRGLHGRPDLSGQCAELDDLRHRRGARRKNAELLRLHGLVGHRHAAGPGAPYFAFRRAALVAERLPRAGRAACLRAAAGSTATASISSMATHNMFNPS